MTSFFFIRLILFVAIIAVALHQRLAPHSTKLNQRIGTCFRVIDRIIGQPLKWIRTTFSPFVIGPGLSLESGHLILLVVLLIALTIL